MRPDRHAAPDAIRRADEPLTTEALAAMLTDQTPASILARNALLTGGSFEIYDCPVPANQFAGIFRGRLQRHRKLGLNTLGGDETIAILRSYGEQPLRTGGIFLADRSWYYRLYLNPDLTEVLACAGHEMRQPDVEAGG